jgi:tRNA G18 (ribose-2'-O)-methylase SpoU
MKNGDFTKPTFLNLPLEQQHKKCAELLRLAYLKAIENIPNDSELEVYSRLVDWMNHPTCKINHPKNIADDYHRHACLAGLHHKEHHLLPHVRRTDKNQAKKSWNISIYLDNIRSAHNVGSILRTVEAFSMGDVYFSKNTPINTHKQVRDTAMGCEQWINCYTDIPLQDLPKPIIALETSDSATSLFDFTFPEKFTIVMGNEEYGCSENTLQICDILLEIPLRGRKNSLNVANAFAIAAGEISRQKQHQEDNFSEK